MIGIPTLAIEHEVPGTDVQLGDFIAHYASGDELTATRIVSWWPSLATHPGWIPTTHQRADGTAHSSVLELAHHYDLWRAA